MGHQSFSGALRPKMDKHHSGPYFHILVISTKTTTYHHHCACIQVETKRKKEEKRFKVWTVLEHQK
jgi:hypothetical protein